MIREQPPCPLSVSHLVPLPEVTLSLVVGKEIQQAKKIPRVWT